MAEGSKVRLVRCPNCDNLLPELPEYSVYQCGGCGTILRAKKRDLRSDILSEKLDEEKGFVGSEKSESSIEKASDAINFASEAEMEDNSGTKSNWRRKERVSVEKNTNFRRTEKREILVREEDFGLISDELKDLRLDQDIEDRYNRYAMMSQPNQPNKVVGSLRTRPRVDFPGPERGRFEGIAGPSNYDPYPFHGQARVPNVPIGVEKLEQERAELIRKLDELKDQLTRPYQEREPVDRNLSRPYPNPRSPYFDQAPNFYSPRTHNHHPPPLPLPPPPPLPHQHHPHMSPQEYYQGQYRNFGLNPDPFEYYHAPPLVPHPYDGGPVNHISNFYRHDEPVAAEPRRGYRHPRDSEIEGYGQPRRTAAREIGRERDQRRRILPVSGGAPFVACQKCFEILRLPRKKIGGVGFKQKLRCGGCSAVILLRVENDKKIVTSIVAEDSNETVLDSVESSFSDDLRQPSFNFRSAVTEHGSLVERLNLEESEKSKEYSSSPSVSSREEDVSEPVDDFPLKTVPSPVPPRSPMWQELGSPWPTIGRLEQGNTSKGTENEDGDKEPDKNNYRDDQVSDLAEPTELDVPFEEYQHNMSTDFAELSKEYQQRLSSKGNSDSFLVGFIKKGFRDISRSSHSVQSERPKVYINGHPLSDRVVKRAEKYAGPIRPGDYWYDYKGGFWGVMGQPCLGIIPPYIEEFNYPMSTNCGAGNTCVYVNGRELHQRDLDLLASRGLSTARNKFYIVEINGKVIDEDTGKEVDSLGKLAPTVEKVKRGFGMKIPRVVTS